MSSSQLPRPMVSPERVDAMWQVSASRILVGPRRRRAALRAGALTLALIATVGSVYLVKRPGTPAVGAVLAATDEPSMVRLADGSEVRLSPRTGVTLEASGPDEVSLTMRGGRASFSVTHRPNRVFKVRAGNVEVRVLGTRFAVDTAKGVEVWVEEGVVEVRTGDRVVHLHAGESWNSDAAPEAAALPPPGVVDPVDAAPEPGAPAVAVRRPAAHPARVHPAAKGAPPGAAPSAGIGSAPVAAVQAPTRDALFDDALEARRSGRTAEARTAWATFLARSSDDPRAGLAAFELGRIAMDVDHQDALALSYLERAISATPGSAFIEDALARVVRLEARHGTVAACQTAKARYASRFPRGTYAASLAALCP